MDVGRLEHLEKQAGCWTGIISAAVYGSGAVGELRRWHRRVEQDCKCSLDLTVAEDAAGVRGGEEVEYPINALRNLALSKAKTEVGAKNGYL